MYKNWGYFCLSIMVNMDFYLGKVSRYLALGKTQVFDDKDILEYPVNG